MSGGLGMGMSDDYMPTTADVRNAWWRDQCPPNDLDFDDVYNAAFNRWLVNELADAVMGFATHYLPHALWVKAKQYADDIREGNT